MALDILSQLNTGDVASRFNSFLESQGLGSMNPSSAARFRQGVEVSPMDEILSLNGIDLDSLFKKVLPEPPPLQAVASAASDADPNLTPAQVGELIQGLGLSLQEQKTLQSLLESGSMLGGGELPGPMLQLLSKPGTNTVVELITQLSSVSSLVSGLGLSQGSTPADILTYLMSALNTDNARYAIERLRRSPKLALLVDESSSPWVQERPILINRLFNATSSMHLLSSSTAEVDYLTGQLDWINEGGIYTSPTEANSVLYRFFVESENRHFYTAIKSERDSIIASQGLSHFIYEGISHRVYDPVRTEVSDGLLPVVRYMHVNTGVHLFTSSASEQSTLESTGSWINEGVAWYGT